MTIKRNSSYVQNPTIEQLRERAEEGGYLGGTGKMDSREWYELCYFEPLEPFLYRVLRAKYPDMSVTDVCVCELVWINQRSIATNHYDMLRRRLDVVFPILGRIPGGKREHARYVMENQGLLSKGAIVRKEHELFSNDRIIDWAIDHARDRGYITGEIEFFLRKEIFDTLEDAFLKECAQSDANIIAKHGKEAFDELTTILKKSQERDFYNRW